MAKGKGFKDVVGQLRKTNGKGQLHALPVPEEIPIPDPPPQPGDIVSIQQVTLLIGHPPAVIACIVTSTRQEGCLVNGWGLLDPERCIAQHQGKLVMGQLPLIPMLNVAYSEELAADRWTWPGVGEELEEPETLPAPEAEPLIKLSDEP